jgi:plastocyanin
MNRSFASLAAALVATVAFAGCGSSNDNSSSSASSDTATTPAATTPAATTPASGGAGSGTLQLKADPSGALKFDTTALSAKAGKVTLEMDNPSPVPHAIAVEGSGVDKKGNTVSQNAKSTVSVKLKAGTYTFYCPVDGHKAAGMKGTLTVK